MNVYLIVLPLVFLAGLIDSIAGGGGLIALPAYVLAGVPIHLAMGTNKLASSLGTLAASLTYFLHRQIWFKLAFFAALWSLAGSYVGARVALWMNPQLLQTFVILMLPFMAGIVLRKKTTTSEAPIERVPWGRVSVVSAAIGFYDGFLGPGTGTLLILAFVGFVHVSYLQASANAKVLNLASGVAALVAFGVAGQVDLILGLWAGLASVLGNVSGSLLAIKFGRGLIKPLLIIVFSALMLSLVWDLLS
jgi:uncharacterized membrane protein YfcA